MKYTTEERIKKLLSTGEGEMDWSMHKSETDPSLIKFKDVADNYKPMGTSKGRCLGVWKDEPDTDPLPGTSENTSTTGE